MGLPKFDAKAIESEARDMAQGRPSKPGKIRFIEGPPTMNGPPHAGHLRGRIIKDAWYRYETLRGSMVEFDAGWDTQGLPVELQAISELGVKGGKAEVMAKVGEERLVAECKKLVHKYRDMWARVDRLLGISLNQDNAYWTYKDEFIEREWRILESAKRQNILAEDHTVIAYCPHCQTSLSHAEVNQGYAEVRDPSMYYRVKLEGMDAHLVVWTTMPFTLVTDAMVGVHPDETYNMVRVDSELWIVGKTRTREFFEEANIEQYDIEGTVRGRELDGKKYIHPLLDRIPGLARLAKSSNYHTVVAEEFVDANTGSGLVHLSPANGEEDIKIANRRNVEVFCPIDDEVRFTTPAGSYAGMFVRDADRIISEDLRAANSLIRMGSIRHNYPLCWRSGHRIVWLARRGWFYRLDRLDGRAVQAAESVEYYYESPRNRFLGIVRERHPWCISRERVWGCPLPVWHCSDCGFKTWCFSRKEIVERAEALPDGAGFELHVPWIDRIRLRCQGCSSPNTAREKYVLDTWHNSGSAPYSSLTDEQYHADIPAPFFTEGIDQTRGWAYTLLVENVILNGGPVPPYRSFLFQGHVLDGKGNKMSKSRGNVIGGEDLLRQYPADMVRFYFMRKASPIEPLNFDTKELTARPYQVVSTLYHLHLYYEQNGKYDGYAGETVQWASNKGLLSPPDVWILSKLQRVISDVTNMMARCHYHEATRMMEEFLIGSLSQFYVVLTRTEIWSDDPSTRDRRLAVYAVLSYVLRTVDVLLHPICPFITEYLHARVFGGTMILAEDWPAPSPDMADVGTESAFDALRECVSVSAAARQKGNLKRRWPLESAILCVEDPARLDGLDRFVLAQLNVGRFAARKIAGAGIGRVANMIDAGLPVVPVLELRRSQVGPKAKEMMGPLVRAFAEADPSEVFSGLRSGSYTFHLERNITLDVDDFEVTAGAAPGYEIATRGNTTVIISTVRDHSMMSRGLLKDVARRIQTLRKTRGHNPTDMLDTVTVLGLDGESQNMLEGLSSELAFLVRVKRVDFAGPCADCVEYDIDGQRVRLDIR